MESYRKRNVSDGDSGFDSALSSRSSSISLEESQELLDYKISKVEVKEELEDPPSNLELRHAFAEVLQPHEDIVQDAGTPDLYLIKDRVSGRETLFKPPSKLSFSSLPPQVEETYSRHDYARSNPIPRSQLFSSRLQLELERQVEKLQLLEVDLLMDRSLVPPPSLGIRVVGVNMIQGVPDKLNIYVKRILEGSVAGQDGRIRVNDHIVEVNGISLVGVSQKLAADALSSCAVNPETGIVHFVLAREPEPDTDDTAQPDTVTSKPEAVEANAEPEDSAATNPPMPEEADHRNSPDRKAEDHPADPIKTPEFVGTNPGSGAFATSDGDQLAPPPAPSLTDAAAAATTLAVANAGESTKFLPLMPSSASAKLEDFSAVAGLLPRLLQYLSADDRKSLSFVNKSFYQALKAIDKNVDDDGINTKSDLTSQSCLPSPPTPVCDPPPQPNLKLPERIAAPPFIQQVENPPLNGGDRKSTKIFPATSTAAAVQPPDPEALSARLSAAVNLGNAAMARDSAAAARLENVRLDTAASSTPPPSHAAPPPLGMNRNMLLIASVAILNLAAYSF